MTTTRASRELNNVDPRFWAADVGRITHRERGQSHHSFQRLTSLLRFSSLERRCGRKRALDDPCDSDRHRERAVVSAKAATLAWSTKLV
jgi:hypothetical protein